MPWRAIGFLIAVLLLPATLRAQPHDLTTPVESPLWWTLTDQVTPAELKALYSDPALSLARRQAAVQVGLEPKLSADAQARLKFYFHPELTPELEPMWLAFRTFYTFHTPGKHARPEYVAAAPEELQSYGVSPAGVNVILSIAMATAADVDSLMAVRGPQQIELTQLIIDAYADAKKAKSLPPKEEVYDAVLERDYAAVAAVVGRPVSEIVDLVDAHADWNSTYALTADALPVLQSQLTVDDWQAFRRYLLGRIVPRKGAVEHFEPHSEETGSGFRISEVPLDVLSESETRFAFSVNAEAEWVGDTSTADRDRFFQTFWWLSHGLGWCTASGPPAQDCQAVGKVFAAPFNQTSVIQCNQFNGCAAHKDLDKPSCQSNGRLYSGRAEVLFNQLGHPMEDRKNSSEGPQPIACADHYSVTATVVQTEPFDPLTLTLKANSGPGTPLLVVETWPVAGSSTATVTFEDHLANGAGFVVEATSSDPEEECQPASGTIAGSSVEVVILCNDPNSPPPPPPPPPNHYPVTVEVIQTSPKDAVSLRLEANDGAGGPTMFIESRVLPAGADFLTFNTPLPDGADFAIFGESSDPFEVCEPVSNDIEGAPRQVPMFCYDLNVPPPPPVWPSLCDILPSFCRDCHTYTVSYEEIPCPPGYGLMPPCYKLVVRDMCFDIGGFFSTATWQMTVPHTNGGPIQGIDDDLPLVVSATHPQGILSMRVLLNGQVIGNYPASGSPTTFNLPISALDTSALAEGTHTIGVYAVTDAPSGPVAVGRTMEFVVDRQGGGGGGNDTTPPTVTLVSPPDQATLPAGVITVTATAADASGIDRVEFFRNGEGQGVRHTDTTPPYTWSWDATANPGWNALQVRAYDDSPNQNSKLSAMHFVDIQPPTCGDTSPPSVALTAPAAGSTHTTGSQIAFGATASDNVGVTKVEFFVDTAKVATDVTAPYSFNWTSSGTGTRTITAKAYDACNSKVSAPRTITLVNGNPCGGDPTPPTVSLTAPAAGSSHPVGVPLTVSANASDNVGITKVEFYRSTSPNPIAVDTTPPWSASWTPGGTGSVTLTAKAFDGCHTTTSAGRTITVTGNPCAGDTTGPAVAVTWPPEGLLPVAEAWEMRASASDPSGVDFVEFLLGGASAGTDQSAPWEVDWTPLPEPGVYWVEARAVDECGNETISPTVQVTLTTGPNPDPPQDP